jgi:hypothetical protein
MDEEKPNLEDLVKGSLERIRFQAENILSACNFLQGVMESHSPDTLRRVCPVCNKGRMSNLSEIVHAVSHLNRMTNTYGRSDNTLAFITDRYANPSLDQEVWECDKCQAISCRGAGSRDLPRWVQGEGSPSTFAGRAFNHNPSIDEVAFDHGSGYEPHKYWYVRVGQEWFRYQGLKDDVLERIGVIT